MSIRRNIIRILQITDLHILPEPGAHLFRVDTYCSLQRVLKSAFELDVTPEAIIASGDLVEDGSLASYRRLRGLLIATGVPVFVLPGNHDTVENMQEALVGGSIQMQPMHAMGGWKFAFLNSQIPGESCGRVTKDNLRELQCELEADPETPCLIALHHPPIAPCSYQSCRLEDADRFLSALSKHPNVKAVISGHAHVENQHPFKHIEIMTTPATCIQFRHDLTPKVDEQTWNKRNGQTAVYDGFKATHGTDPTRHGYRILDLRPDGQFTTDVHWVTN